MAEWRLLRGWSTDALKARMDGLAAARPNVDAVEEQMTGEHGWDHFRSDAVIAQAPADAACFERARLALAHYGFSDPAIVTAHFNPSTPLLGRRMLLEIKVLGLHYLCPALVSRVRDEGEAFSFRYDTLQGHIERGVEWFHLTRGGGGEIRFSIEARFQRGDLPNWWSRMGFPLLAGHYRRRWHRQAHRRMSLLARYGSVAPPRADASGLTHQGVEVTFTSHTKRT